MQKMTASPRSKFFCALVSLSMLSLVFTSNSLQAQNSFCPNETPLFTENFGSGTTFTSHPDVEKTVLEFQASGPLTNEGVYRIANSTLQKPEWHSSKDHTGNTNGKMLVVNGNGFTFYSHTVNSPTGFTAGFYSASLYLMNVNKLGTCGEKALLPIISFTVEYQAENGSWVLLDGAPVTTPPVVQTATPTWIRVGGVFTLPLTGSFLVKNIRVTLKDGITGGCGNDYALDDITFSTCPSGGPVPVQFLGVAAKQIGNRVNINWSTASETNNKYFDVEKSIDGGFNWSLVATTKTGGNSAVVKKYEAVDARPVAGLNFYRIKQVDIDGQYKYSVTVNVKLTVDRSSAFVLSNPFAADIPVELLSTKNQSVSLALYDLAGKSVASDRWSIAKGSSRKSMENVGNLQRGMYILVIKDQNGETLYNGKLIKQ
ncbi:MAG: T9SS type A sorting domain-containing protein [Bacteroidota bacterium]